MKRFTVILAAAVALLSAIPQRSEARTMKDFFISMPDELMPMLDEGTRKDLVDICLSGMRTALPNNWRGTSSLSLLNDYFLVLCEDSECHVQTVMTLLHSKTDTIVCVVRTLATPEPASEIRFYSTKWRELKTEKLVKLPDVAEFERDEQKVALSPMRVELLRIGIQAGDDHSAQLNITTNTSANDIRYDWNGKRFVRRKQ